MCVVDGGAHMRLMSSAVAFELFRKNVTRRELNYCVLDWRRCIESADADVAAACVLLYQNV